MNVHEYNGELTCETKKSSCMLKGRSGNSEKGAMGI
jgi:hypothetical protein